MQTYDLDWDGEEVFEVTGAATAEGLTLAAEYLLAKAKEVVPLEEATLERSGVASVDEEELEAAVSFDTPYAARQHEELTWRHAPGRKAKYLEETAVEERETIAELIAAPPSAALGGI